jgi:hypothetical protein
VEVGSSAAEITCAQQLVAVSFYLLDRRTASVGWEIVRLRMPACLPACLPAST